MNYRTDLLGSVRDLVSLIWGVMSRLLRFLWLMVTPKAVLAAKVLALQSPDRPGEVSSLTASRT